MRRSLCKVAVIPVGFYMKLEFSGQILGEKNAPILKFIKICSVRAEVLFHVDEETDIQTRDEAVSHLSLIFEHAH